MKFIYFFLILIIPLYLQAEVVELPQEELASETVLPIFDHSQAVKNRRVKESGHLELALGVGWNLTEALYENMNFNAEAIYHFSHTHGLALSAYFINQGLSSTGESLKNGEGLDAGDNFDAELAPTLENLYFVNYQLNAYYGKISLTKKSVLNLSLYGFAGVGLAQYSDGESPVAIDFGLGQNLYLTPHWAFKFDLRFIAFSGPDPTNSKSGDKLDPDTNGTQLRSSSDFNETTYLHTYLSTSLVYLF